MKRFLLILLCCFLLSSCAKAEPAPTEAAQQYFSVYYGDENAEKLLSTQVQVPQIDESTVIGQLIAAGVLQEGIAVNSLEQIDGVLYIDFNRAFAEIVCSMGTSGEYIIIGSTVNTFLNAFQCTSMVFTVDGEILESGHVIYDFPLEFMS